MRNLLDVIVIQTGSSWALLALTLLAIVSVPRLFGLKFFTGLLFAQAALFFNAIPIIAGLESHAISVERGVHFYLVEFTFFALTFAIYSRMLEYRVQILTSFQKLFDGKWALLLTLLMIAMTIFNYLMTPTDGSSRIGYRTEAWFSLIKPFIQIITPLSFLGVFILILNPTRRFLGYVWLGIAVAANIATGSKASFVIGLLTSFLVLRDLSEVGKLQLRPQDKWKISVFVVVAGVFALSRLEVTFSDIVDRLFLTADATILTYFSDHPTAACENVSTFASMHRGFARLLGDASATDIDTLFGFALTIQQLGVNTFTGPNARLSAYMLCNFPGERIILGACVVLVYFVLMQWLFKRLLRRPLRLALVYPFLIASLGGASQDFNLIMQDITIFLLLLATTLTIYSKKAKHQLG